MRNLTIFAIAMTISAAGLAQAQQTVNFATGLDSSGNVQLSGDLLDANWTITGGQTMKNGATAGQAFTVTSGDADWYGGWQANGPNSSWITQNPDSADNGLIDAKFTFNLDQSQLASAVFSNMGVSLDDSGQVLLNGNVEVSGLSYGNAGALTPFTINPADLVAGQNTLEIQVTGTDYNLEAVRLEGMLTVQSVPAPKGIFLLAAAPLILLLRKRLA